MSQMLCRAAATLLLLALAIPVHADQPLRWRWTVGDRTRTVLEVRQVLRKAGDPEADVDQTMTITLRTVVKAVDAEGVATLEYAAERIALTLKLRGKPPVTADTGEDPVGGHARQIQAQLNQQLGKRETARFDARGRKMDAQKPDPTDNLPDAMPHLPLPEQALEVGDSWTVRSASMGHRTPLEHKLTSTYRGLLKEGTTVHRFTQAFDIKTPADEPGPQARTVRSKGVVDFDVARGMVVARSSSYRLVWDTPQGERVFDIAIESKVEPLATKQPGASSAGPSE